MGWFQSLSYEIPKREEDRTDARRRIRGNRMGFGEFGSLERGARMGKVYGSKMIGTGNIRIQREMWVLEVGVQKRGAEVEMCQGCAIEVVRAYACAARVRNGPARSLE